MIYKGTATELILKALLYKTHTYKEVEEMLRKHNKYKDKSSSSIRNTLSSLKNKGLVTSTSVGWTSGKLAESMLKNRDNFLEMKYSSKYSSVVKKQKEEIIIMYDIPESLKQRRNRLREGLKILGFKQKQKSVWIGPAPIPKDFLDFLVELKIIEYINFFRVRGEDIV